MNTVQVKVPELSESVSEATLLEWKRKPGDIVAADEILIEIETDKVVLEVPSPAAGQLAEIRAQNGQTVVSGEVIAVIDTDASVSASASTDSSRAPSPAPVEKTIAEPRVMPSAAAVLAAAGIDAKTVIGTGPGNRITKVDALAAAEPPVQPQTAEPAPRAVPASRSAAAPAPAEPIAPDPYGRKEDRVPMTRLRRRVAERLVQSLAGSAQLTTFNEVDMSAVIALRARYKEKFERRHGIKLGFMSFFVKAAVYALEKFPVLNASIDGTDIIYHSYFDIGVAVGTERGLVVPVVRNADQKTFAEIELEIADFAKRAQAGKLSIEELSGGTFTVSNGGVFGSMLSTPIINPPQSAILGIHATKERPVVVNGEIVIRPMNYLALSYDHRLIDGREAVLGLGAMKAALEDPAVMLLDI
ncbi:2-oxoglutarate dehydrogenase complex dihydrolipoyllysine-residue succinyltransferase [Sutterella sp. AM11-39]|uniref:2-oxoglutarate dehydrogenase complex dihydrolipoyllysine-residue succinyltransferase n=1 Tax=Sutterella sp. AM11-39 TaxID=2292075 RepID=UPI000E552654|nr:2-oxoglutarate dehydrogenase complex dihydrolipoyllysine-residue succinyltransferase [Sutterella sp. AM11-39]RHJ33986.1 2-oxoglutarate dehydrogenase complex dihydrolipoyllysine-residue succinyltransferase [Sutterella sp. AM11-39]